MKHREQKLSSMPLGKRIVSLVLIAAAAMLLVASVLGFVFRSGSSTRDNLNKMSTSAVLHTVSDGLVDYDAVQARNAYYWKCRDNANKKEPWYYRNMGQGQFEQNCNDEYARARAEATEKYGTIDLSRVNTQDLEKYMSAFADSYQPAGNLLAEERTLYAERYTTLYKALSGCADMDLEADALNALVAETLPDITGDQAQLAAFTQMAQDVLPKLKEEAAASDTAEEAEEEAAETEITVTVNEAYFVRSQELIAKTADSDTAYDNLWAELVKAVPALADVKPTHTEEEIAKLKKEEKDAETARFTTYNNLKDEIATIIYSSTQGFVTRYETYSARNAGDVLSGSEVFRMKLASLADTLLILCIAVILFAGLYIFWAPVTKKLGVPRAIILLFFIYLCLAAQFFRMNVPMLLGDVLMRVGMYGILVLAMVPGIQCGIGLNMGMTIGCISGLLACMIGLQWELTGAAGMIITCLLSILIAVPLGILYALLLNRMKGSEMTITTYVGYSFVALMCIFWMMLPFTNRTLLNLQLGYGLRVTHSLLNSYAYLLNKLGQFTVLGATVPTGLLLLVLLLCGGMWLFSRSRLGTAMSAVGSNPRFAEASGINVNKMRVLGTTLSTVIAAVGIVIYSSAFGYAQLYNAPRQLGFIAASAILIGGATVSKAKVSHVLIGTFLFEGVLTLGQQVANAAIAGGGLSEVMRILISNGIILYALAQSGGASRE